MRSLGRKPLTQKDLPSIAGLTASPGAMLGIDSDDRLMGGMDEDVAHTIDPDPSWINLAATIAVQHRPASG